MSSAAVEPSTFGKIVVMGGCGHVGLPLAVNLSIAGFHVAAVDISEKVVEEVMAGVFPFVENGGDRYLRAALAKGLKATTDSNEYKDAKVVVIITGMDVDKYGNPNFSLVVNHFNYAMTHAPEDCFFIFRSTLAPGTMELLVKHYNEQRGRVDGDRRLAYCPERTAEKFALEEIQVLPQIVSAFTEEAFDFAWGIFANLTGKGLRLSPVEAEVAKLLANAWRYCEFSISNYFYIELTKLIEPDRFHTVLDSIRYEYPRAQGFKYPGFAAGPCLLKDITMISADGGSRTTLSDSAILTNEGLPGFAIELLMKELRLEGLGEGYKVTLPLQGKTIGILGMTFKANVDDSRCSLAFKLRKLLLKRGAKVLCADPYLKEEGMTPLEEVLEGADAFILGAPHDIYKPYVFSNQTVPAPSKSAQAVIRVSKPCIDVWGLHHPPAEVLKGSPKTSLSAGLPTILVTGSNGFIAGYMVQELLDNGYHVIGIDNYSKYGKVEKEYDNHPHYEFYYGDAKDVPLMKRLAAKCDYVLACAAMIGGISYFHEFAYDLLAENDRITAATFDAAIHAFKNHHLKKIIVLSSSMVFESSNTFPTPESAITDCPPPQSTYGFQKLACEYYAKGAWEQHKLPYTIIRPFNCVGVGEKRALCDHDVMSGNIKLAMSHVVPDLMQKIIKGQDPLRILGNGQQIRHYTYGGDLARGIRLCIEHPDAINNDFNISTPTSTNVLELAELIWNKYYQGAKPFRYESDPPFKYDVQSRIPDCTKAKEVLGFEATTTLEEILDELFPWIKQQIEFGNL
eukprot:gene9714-10744_t